MRFVDPPVSIRHGPQGLGAFEHHPDPRALERLEVVQLGQVHVHVELFAGDRDGMFDERLQRVAPAGDLLLRGVVLVSVVAMLVLVAVFTTVLVPVLVLTTMLVGRVVTASEEHHEQPYPACHRSVPTARRNRSSLRRASSASATSLSRTATAVRRASRSSTTLRIPSR